MTDIQFVAPGLVCIDLLPAVEALPVGTVVREEDGSIYMKFSNGFWYSPGHLPGSSSEEILRNNRLTILHHPEWPAAQTEQGMAFWPERLVEAVADQLADEFPDLRSPAPSPAEVAAFALTAVERVLPREEENGCTCGARNFLGTGHFITRHHEPRPRRTRAHFEWRVDPDTKTVDGQ